MAKKKEGVAEPEADWKTLPSTIVEIAPVTPGEAERVARVIAELSHLTEAGSLVAVRQAVAGRIGMVSPMLALFPGGTDHYEG
jgi:hypothetical protein